MYIYVKGTCDHCTLDITLVTSDFAQEEIVSTNHKVEVIGKSSLTDNWAWYPCEYFLKACKRCRQPLYLVFRDEILTDSNFTSAYRY